MKSIIAAAVATLMLASGALAAPGVSHDFYPDGHESYTGLNGRQTKIAATSSRPGLSAKLVILELRLP